MGASMSVCLSVACLYIGNKRDGVSLKPNNEKLLLLLFLFICILFLLPLLFPLLLLLFFDLTLPG
jgi:hypothetical protein